MTAAPARRPSRRWLAPEVVQTSTMDCGPAALKCLLEGFHVPVSYGRLREACQTDVDGTSIDTIEVVAGELGLQAAQVMIPVEHVLSGAANLPALVVVRHADGPTHFVVAWRRVGPWVQVMDPALGRRWVPYDRFLADLVRHRASVPAGAWREWAGTDDGLVPLRARLAHLGGDAASIEGLVARALADAGWFTMGALDASARVVGVMAGAGGVSRGTEAFGLLTALFDHTCESPSDIFAFVPASYWSVTPDTGHADPGLERLMLAGAVLLRAGRASTPVDVAPGVASDGRTASPSTRHLSPELAAALDEPPARPLAALRDLLSADGLLGPLALSGALAVSAGVLLVEALLFRSVFEMGTLLPLGSQRLAAAAGLLVFMGVALAFEVPIVSESLRMGRRLDARLRMALLRKLPRLADRYLHSRPISDLAERGHSIHHTRRVPAMGMHFLRSAFELVLTLAGILLIDPPSVPLAAAIAGLSMAVPAVFQPLISERDLRVRNHAGALSRFYLDALLGLVPIRAHRAEGAIRHQHQSLLVEWVRSTHRLMRTGLLASTFQAVGCMGLAALLLVRHFLRADGVTGADLLLVYWTLKLPTTGYTLMSLAHQYPSQRNILLRLLEPLAAPEHMSPAPTAVTRPADDPRGVPTAGSRGATGILIERGRVVAGGHTILRDLDLRIAPGEHVAIVGVSGAGKSTLLGLLLGWHRLADGRLLVDGRPLTDEDVPALRRRTAWVDPAVQVWNRSLMDNLAFSSPHPDPARIRRAIDGARLRDVLRTLPAGLQTRLGEGGALLSGGEGQRVRLARALAQPDVALALLDEPFRGLDASCRSSLLTETRAHWRAATLLCVTHDVAETRAFDRVLVVEDGRIQEDDSPVRLASRRSRYRALLDAEQRVRERLWQGAHWRRLRVGGGRIDGVSQPLAAAHLVSSLPD